MVLFGATGDLARRLVMPALYNLSRTKVLPEKFALIGVGRTKETAESWGGHLYDMLKSFVDAAAAEFDIDHIDEAVWKRLAARMSYVQGDLTTPELYEKLRGTLDEAAKAMALRAMPSSISRSPIDFLAPWSSSSARSS
jgi:glucose-6-phosphate 1-dehydrogenase